MYETVQHNKCVICSKLIMSQCLGTLQGRKGIRPPTWKLDFTPPLIRVDYTSPPLSPQTALKVAESVPKKSKLSKHFPLFEQISKKSFEVM